MDNIFENAKFGDKFRTRDGRMAVYICEYPNDDTYRYIVHVKGYYKSELYCWLGKTNMHAEDRQYDIVGKWQEPINEEELDKLADEYAEEAPMSGGGYYGDTEYWTWDDVVNAFKAGYRKAKVL